MKNNSVRALLFLTTLTMTVLPMIAAFYFLDHTLQTSLNLGFNSDIVRTLNHTSQNLKRLKTTDPENESIYREQFDEVESLRQIYAKPDLVRDNVLNSLKIYFGFGLALVTLMSLVIATFLSRKIARAYQNTFNKLIQQQERVRYLEEISAWQELAKMLAHEIKNPLTPIEVLVTSLTKSYLNKSDVEFKKQLLQTEAMVGEELQHLNGIVNRFSEFSRVPKVHLIQENLISIIQQNVKLLHETYDSAKIEVVNESNLLEIHISIDATLFRQVLMNIVKNGIEANPGKPIKFEIKILNQMEQTKISISNDGVPVPIDLAKHIFDPYVSGKKGKDNMGIGLAIVKKIIIEHGAEINYSEKNGQPVFNISFGRTN